MRVLPISGFEGIYSIREDGSVWAHPKDGSGGHEGKWLKPWTTSTIPYHTYSLSKGNTKKHMSAHRLVALHFIPNPANHPILNHRDGDKFNNHHTNLEWCTFAHNNQHSWDMGLKKAGVNHRERFRALGKARTGKLFPGQWKIPMNIIAVAALLHVPRKVTFRDLGETLGVNYKLLEKSVKKYERLHNSR